MFLYFTCEPYTHCVCVFCLFQMNISVEEMDSSTENNSILHLDAPILPDNADISNLTIIQTSNGSFVADHIFLNTVAAQALSGIFVFCALLMTCHQVSLCLPRQEYFLIPMLEET